MPESVTPRDLRSVLRVPCLVSSVRDAPLVSARAAGIPKPTHFSPPVPELIPLPVVLPTMGIALWCIWAAYTTTEILETAAATKMSPEVAADAAEPPGVVVHAAVFPGATPAAVSPEVAADAAEPTEAAVLPLIPCMVVAPSNALAACHVTIKGTITELSAFVETPDGTAVEPLEVAASTAEPPEVSVVSTYQLLPCPVTAKKAVCELSPCPVTAKEAVCELSPCPVTAKEAVCELSPCPVTAKKAVCELSPCPVTAMEAAYESSSCPITAMKAVYELPGCSVPATEATLEPLPCSEPAEEAITGLSLCPELAKVSEVEPFVCPISICESVFCPTSPVTTPETLPKLSLGSSSPVTAQRPAVELLTLSVMNFEPLNALPVLSVSALPVLSVSALPRSRSLPWFPAQSASLCWSSVWSAPPRWPSAQVWWPSAPPWGSSARVRWSSALPWRTSAPPWWAPGPSAPPWWAPVPSSPPWLPALPTLPRSTATPLPRGPGPPSLPLFRLRSTALLDYIGASGSRSLGGGAMSRILSMHFRSFTTRGHSLTTLTLALHELLHTITKYNSHHPLALTSHSWLHWSRSHLRTLTQSLSPNHTRFISLGLPLALCRVLYCVYHSHSDSYLMEPSQ